MCSQDQNVENKSRDEEKNGHLKRSHRDSPNRGAKGHDGVIRTKDYLLYIDKI